MLNSASLLFSPWPAHGTGAGSARLREVGICLFMGGEDREMRSIVNRLSVEFGGQSNRRRNQNEVSKNYCNFCSGY